MQLRYSESQWQTKISSPLQVVCYGGSQWSCASSVVLGLYICFLTIISVLMFYYTNHKSCLSVTGIARCFTFGGSRNRLLHDPNIQPRSDLSKEQYMKKDEQTTVNHFHEKLLKLKDMMKTKVKESVEVRSNCRIICPVFPSSLRCVSLP